MSYCAIITFKDGKPDSEIEFKNAWRGAAFIWTSLFDKYIKSPDIPYDNWLSESRMNDLWDLANREDLSDFEIAVHTSTFDRAIIRKEHFAQFAQHLREFMVKYPSENSHLNAWADFVESCDAEAIGFYGTSVSEFLWSHADENEETIFYDLNNDDRHFEIYDRYLTDVGAKK